jgi:bacterial/archaeal transporter family-2 protein
MPKETYYAIAFIAGLAVAIQTAVNAQLRLTLNNPTLTALFSFCVGTVILSVYVAFTSHQSLPALSTLAGIQWWKWLGGVMGAFYITSVVVAAPRIGAANTLGLIVAGQLIFSVIFDHFGWLGLPVRSINLPRILGILLLILGVYLIRR